MTEQAKLLEEIKKDKVALQILQTLVRVAKAENKTLKQVYDYFVLQGWL